MNVLKVREIMLVARGDFICLATKVGIDILAFTSEPLEELHFILFNALSTASFTLVPGLA
jgi:hypothetical protein